MRSFRRVASDSPYAGRIGFSAAVEADGWVTTAGMTAVGPDGEVVGGGSAYAQAREALRKALAALEAAGATVPEQVVQTRLYVTDAAHADDVGRAHAEVFADHPPAATMVVVGLLDPRMLVEVELRAYIEARRD